MREMKPEEVMATLFGEAADLRARLEEAEAANTALKATIRSLGEAVRGGNADKTTADLLRWVASRVTPLPDDRSPPSGAIFAARANFLDWAEEATRSALFPHPKPPEAV